MSVHAPAHAPTADVFVKRRVHHHVRAFMLRWPVALFGVGFAGYATLGYLVMLRWHIIVGDGVSRLAHAYFVFYNQPPKLAAIGFVWPPLLTIVLLPFATVKPLVTSLVALPLMSALFGAALVVTLDRTLALLELRKLIRLPLLALLALNPMLLFYAANGMGEIVYLFLLSAGVYTFLRWYLEPTSNRLILMSGALTLALLSRYELLLWAIAIGIAVAAGVVRRRQTREEVEGTVITFFAPVTYGLGLWVFFNWLILRDPFYWLHSEVTQTFVATRTRVSIPLASALSRTFWVTWHLYPATLIVVGALLAFAVLRRDFVSLVLAAAIALNPMTTALLAVGTQSEQAFQLRYGLRSVPLVLIGLAWLWRQTGTRPGRVAAWLLAVVLLAGSIPSTWHTMRTYRQQALEQAFTRALTTGADQEGTRSLGIGVPVGEKPERAAASWVLAHVHARDAVLADDAQAFEVMVFTGRPDLFADRTDHGDARWLQLLADPFGRVRYFLVSSQGHDLIRDRYPSVLTGGVLWLRPVFANARWTVLRVGSRPRPETGLA